MNNYKTVSGILAASCCVALSAQQAVIRDPKPSVVNTCKSLQSCVESATALYGLARGDVTPTVRDEQLKKVLKDTETCIGSFGGDRGVAECYHIRAKVFYVQTHYEESEQNSRDAIARDDSVAEYHWILGKANYQLHRYTKAQSAMQNCLARRPQDDSAAVECAWVLGKTLLAQKPLQCQNAVEPLEHALEEAKLRDIPIADQAEVRLSLGQAYKCIGEVAKAIEQYEAASDTGDGETKSAAKRALQNSKNK